MILRQNLNFFKKVWYKFFRIFFVWRRAKVCWKCISVRTKFWVWWGAKKSVLKTYIQKIYTCFFRSFRRSVCTTRCHYIRWYIASTSDWVKSKRVWAICLSDFLLVNTLIKNTTTTLQIGINTITFRRTFYLNIKIFKSS